MEPIWHPLTDRLALALPTESRVREIPQGIAAECPPQDWRLNAFQRPAAGGADAAQLHAAVLATLGKRHPDAVVLAAASGVAGVGWQGIRSVLRLPAGRQLRVLTILEATESPVLVGVMLDCAEACLASLPTEWLQQRSQSPVTSPSAGHGPSLGSLSLVPIDPVAEQRSESSAPAADRARFDAREPVRAAAAGVATRAPPLPPLNPYQPPESVAPAAAALDDEALRAAAGGQRILVWCVLLSFALRGLSRNPDVPVFLTWFIAVGLMAWAFRGVLLIASGFGYGRGVKLGLLFGSTVPLLGIGLWVWLSMKTTRALKAAGHTVGFFGVKS